MKRIVIVSVSVLVVAALVLGGSTALAAKPQQVIEWSNGFPSGPHFNLNIHGKNWETCQATCDPIEGCGNSIFIPEYGNATIKFISNKKSSVTELTVLEPPCGGFEGEAARIQLPYFGSEGYQVYWRILGKPNHGKAGNESNVLLYPNPILHACNDTGDPHFGNYTDCEEALGALGLITTSGAYQLGPQGLERFDPGSSTKHGKGEAKGKSKAVDITGLFIWSGWVANATLDIAEPFGELTDADIPADANVTVGAHFDLSSSDPEEDPIDNGDYGNDSGTIDLIAEWLAFQNYLDPEMAWHVDDVWVFDLADLVVQDQTIQNDGTKLVQVRFYPVATTEFTR